MTLFAGMWRRSAGAAVAVTAILIAALWVAICSAAPELIWQGLRQALGHVTRADAIEAVLLGVVLAFFVEPLMRRVQNLARRGRVHLGGESGNPLFAATLGVAFAIASVCVHDALVTFVAKRDGGLAAALRLTTSWAIVPGVVTLAWLGARRCRLAQVIGVVAAFSAGIVGWLFSWTGPEVISSSIPALAILGFGYRRAVTGPARRALLRCAPVVVAVGVVWLAAAILIDALLRLGHDDAWQIYRAGEAWVDARFYLGWTLGLVLAPAPAEATRAAGTPPPDDAKAGTVT